MRELLGILETPLESNRPLVERARHVTDRRREILQLQRLHDLPDAHTHGLQRLWLELDRQLALLLPEDQDVGDPGQRAQLARDPRVDEPRHLRRRECRRRKRERHDRPIGIILFLDDRLLHLHGKIRPNGRDPVSYILRRFVEILFK